MRMIIRSYITCLHDVRALPLYSPCFPNPSTRTHEHRHKLQRKEEEEEEDEEEEEKEEEEDKCVLSPDPYVGGHSEASIKDMVPSGPTPR